MQKCSLLFIAGFISLLALAQNNGKDSLEKYSYYIFGYQKTQDGLSMQTVEGTCFFVRMGEKIFIVSARHLMTSWSTADSSKPAQYPDTLFIRFPAKDTTGFVYYPVDIRDTKAHARGSYYYNQPDIFVTGFSDTGKIQINAIESIAILNPPKGLLASAVVYGFPPLPGDRWDNLKTKDASYLQGRLFSSPEEDISYRDNARNMAVRDSTNYLIKFTTPVQGGYSGAPVFLKNDGSEKWYFAGLVSQGVPNDNYFFIIKPVFLLREINKN